MAMAAPRAPAMARGKAPERPFAIDSAAPEQSIPNMHSDELPEVWASTSSDERSASWGSGGTSPSKKRVEPERIAPRASTVPSEGKAPPWAASSHASPNRRADIPGSEDSSASIAASGSEPRAWGGSEPFQLEATGAKPPERRLYRAPRKPAPVRAPKAFHGASKTGAIASRAASASGSARAAATEFFFY